MTVIGSKVIIGVVIVDSSIINRTINHYNYSKIAFSFSSDKHPCENPSVYLFLLCKFHQICHLLGGLLPISFLHLKKKWLITCLKFVYFTKREAKKYQR